MSILVKMCVVLTTNMPYLVSKTTRQLETVRLRTDLLNLLGSQTNIDMMYHHNMLSITAFTFRMSFAREPEIYVQNWLSTCLPTLAGILHSATKSQLYAKKKRKKNQTIEPQTFSNDECYINDYSHWRGVRLQTATFSSQV